MNDLDEPAELCTMSAVLENLTKNAFTLMAKTSSIAEVMKEWPAESPDELMVQSMTLGEDFGTFLRFGIDFIPLQ